MKYSVPHTKISGTSFIIHDSYIAGTRYAAKHCDDVAILLTTVGKDGEWLPTQKELAEVQKIVDGEGISLHIHLPTDGHCTSHKDVLAYYKNIVMALDVSSVLNAHTYVQHLDIVPYRYTDIIPNKEQEESIREMLANIAKALPSPEMLAIENLESFAFNYLDFCFVDTKYSRCIDIGHIWKDRKNPAEILPLWLENTRLVHLHGLRPKLPFNTDLERFDSSISIESMDSLFGQIIKDHSSLEYMPNKWIDDALFALWKADFKGAINIEIFNEKDFAASCDCISKSRQRFESKFNKF